MAKNHFVPIDAGRGLAAGMVLIHHLDVFFRHGLEALFGTGMIMKVISWISESNTQAVMLFFVISGFCIRASSKTSRFSQASDALEYFRRRGARIVPLYWLALAVTYFAVVIASQKSSDANSISTLVGNIVFLQSPASTRGCWFPPFGENGPLWSISFEVFYYVVFPLAILIETWLFRPSERSPIIALVGSYAVSLFAVGIYNVNPNPIALFMTLYCVWRIGVCCYDVFDQKRGHGLALSALVAISISLFLVLYRFPSDTLSLVFSGTCIGALWIAAQSSPSWLWQGRAIRAIFQIFAVIGSISYALYLLQYPILSVVRDRVGSSWFGPILAVVAVLVAATVAEKLGDWVRVQFLASLRVKRAERRV